MLYFLGWRYSSPLPEFEDILTDKLRNSSSMLTSATDGNEMVSFTFRPLYLRGNSSKYAKYSRVCETADQDRVANLFYISIRIISYT